MKRITYKQIRDAVKAQCPSGTYHLSALSGSDDAHAIESAVNQGIDSHLEACSMQGLDTYVHTGGRLVCEISPESLPVLLRRLTEMAFSEDDEAESLVRDILTTLELDDEYGDFEIINEATECEKS